MAKSAKKDTLYQVVGIVAGLAIILGGKACLGGKPSSAKAQSSLSGLAQIMDAVSNKRAGVMVQHWGTVTRAVADDRAGGADKLQKFIVMLENGHMLLFAHNIDIAARVPVSSGDRLEFRGRFDWNDIGGLIHRTHHDPQMVLDDGWIKHGGKVYR